MRNKRYLKSVFFNEYLLIKSMKAVFILILVFTCFIFPAIFINIQRVKPELFYATVMRLSQFFFPLFSAILTIFILRNYIEQYNCEIYFLHSKIKLREALFVLVFYCIALLVPFLICARFDDNMRLEYVRVICQCVLFSSMAYLLLFITMSIAITIIPIFAYLLFSSYSMLYNSSDEPQKFVFCSLEKVSSTNIISTVFPFLAVGLAFYAVGVVVNIYRSKRYNASI